MPARKIRISASVSQIARTVVSASVPTAARISAPVSTLARAYASGSTVARILVSASLSVVAISYFALGTTYSAIAQQTLPDATKQSRKEKRKQQGNLAQQKLKMQQAQTDPMSSGGALQPQQATPQQDPAVIAAELGERLAALEERVLGLQHPLDSIADRTSALETELYGGSLGSDSSQIFDRIAKLEQTVFKNASKDGHDLPDGMSTYVESKKIPRRSSGKLRNY